MPYRRLAMVCLVFVIDWAVPRVIAESNSVIVESKTVDQFSGEITVGIYIPNYS